MRAYARAYVGTQQLYNGSRRGETLAGDARFANRRSGRVSYWDVSPGVAGVQGVGEMAESPFLTAEGQVRIFSHYLAEGSQAELVRRFGQPTGSMPAEMTSSYRTLVVYPRRGIPYQLKFSGEWYDAQKILTNDQVRHAVAASRQFAGEPALQREPAGLVLDIPGANVVYRPLPRPTSRLLRSGDQVLNAHVLQHDQFFSESPIGRRLFPRPPVMRDWLHRELAPRVAKLLYRSLTRTFGHYELHGQNVSILVARGGRVRDVFVSDQQDHLPDPVLAAAAGHPIGLLPPGDAFPPGTVYDVRSFYKHLDNLDRFPRASLEDDVRADLLALVRKQRDTRLQERYPEYQRVFGAPAGDETARLSDTLADLRELLVKSGLEQRFRADPGAKADLERPGGTIIGSRIPFFGNLTNGPGLELGYVGSIPVSLRRNKAGLIDTYYFRFD
jgi:hypothetical protein